MVTHKYRMFLDDERYPTDPHWLIARSSYDAMHFVREFGVPIEIAFDHDLKGVDTAMIFVHWLVNEVLDGTLELPDGFTFSVHSQNPIGAENIRSMMTQLLEHTQ